MQASVANYKQRALKLARPLGAHLELTYHCNWRCVFCYNPRHFDLKRLDLAKWIEVFDDLRKLGTLSLSLTGGEPLAHPQFFEIAEAARERAFALRIFTNGALIRTADVAQRLAALKPSVIEMSLHGATAAVHDAATQRPGSFDALMRAIDLAKVSGAPLLLKSPITKLNEHELDEMIALTAKLTVPYQIDPGLTPRDDGDMSPLDYTLSPTALKRVTEIGVRTGSISKQERESGGVNCGLGRITIAIDPEGNVYPCPQWRHTSLGNVREMSLLQMWQTSPVREEAAAVAKRANDMLIDEGGAVSEFSFCPALAFQRTGDTLGIDADLRARALAAAEARASNGR